MMSSASSIMRSSSARQLVCFSKKVTTVSAVAVLQRNIHQQRTPHQALVVASVGNSSSQDSSSSHSVAPPTPFDPPPQISKINTHYHREPQLVMIEGHGILQGQMDQSRLMTKYLNIPFATVQDQFQPAVPPAPWSGIRDATVLGPMCPQEVHESNSMTTMMLGLPGPGFEYSERDCLNLNVYAPRCVEHVPVICYIHGGVGEGGNALPRNDATNIVKKSIAREKPVIVVTINYRLLPSAGLLESSERKTEVHGTGINEAANWGLYDQKIALEWVRRNIHNFGGNPNEVTLMGHSSGASSAGYHLLTADHGGLFRRAIMHSGARPRESRAEDSNVIIPYESLDSSRLVQQVQKNYERSKTSDEGSSFTFMSDACLPHMSERDKQNGFRVIDRWIDFAWGQESDLAAAASRNRSV